MEDSNINHPSHYQGEGNIECIDAMLAAFGDAQVASFCKLNAFKYLWRSDHKGKLKEDVEKAIWYLEFYKDLIDKDE